nr:vegetative cell wall protein gp1-like [Aegilops tauschii subsp. strangulata]
MQPDVTGFFHSMQAAAPGLVTSMPAYPHSMHAGTQAGAPAYSMHTAMHAGAHACRMYTDMDASSLDFNLHAALPPPIGGYPALPPPPVGGAGYEQRQSASSPWHGQSVVAPPPAPSGAASHTPVPTYGAYGAPPVYGSPGYRWGSSAGQHSPAGQQPVGTQHLSAGQQVFPAGHPAYPAPQLPPRPLSIPYGPPAPPTPHAYYAAPQPYREYPPPQLSGGYALPMASPSPSPTLPPTPWDLVLLTRLHAARTLNNYTGGDDWYMDTGATAHMFAHPGTPGCSSRHW